MPKLILIKHAPPEIEPAVSSEKWRLGDKGRALCEPLSKLIAPHQPKVIISSVEPKAAETARELSRHLGIPARATEGLHEHDRRNVAHMRSRDFIAMVELFFRRSHERVLGKESADEASTRFDAAIDAIVKDHPDQTLAIVTHGTVLALFLARHNPDQNGFALWRQLGLPSFAVVDLPGYKITDLLDRVEPS